MEEIGMLSMGASKQRVSCVNEQQRQTPVLLPCAHQLARGGLNGRHDVHVNTLADISFTQ